MNQSILLDVVPTFYISDKTNEICTWLLYSVLCQIINIFGIVTNIINIVCFVKQGFKESTNISLLGLSVSDLVGLILLAGSCICLTPAVVKANLPFDSIEVSYLIFMMPHFAFTRVGACITAFISLERCLSIVAPLKVKQIITPKRAGMCIVCIFIIFTFSATPIYTVSRLGAKFANAKNTTVVGLILTDNKEQVEMYTFFINNCFIPFGAFIIVTVCTAILTSHLRVNSEWSKTNVSDVMAQKIPHRNKKVAKMVVVISTLFISCIAPVAIIMLALALVPDMSIDGKYFHAAKILGGFTLILESINSSANIFIYHHMSAKYRDTFKKLFIRKLNISS